MIQNIQSGKFSLSETQNQIKILDLENDSFAWIKAKNIGDILVTSNEKHPIQSVLTKGSYRLYKVKDEPKLTDLLHLELHAGEGKWQGYLLPTGLPTESKKRARIIPTKEIITKSLPH
jgi:hypothetical protein